jgi:hypothetical protein
MNPNHPIRLTRRRCLQIGGLGWLHSALLPGAQSPDSTAERSKIKSCILIFHYGGPSHLETYDPKPNAPADIRGEYQTISTVVPGVRVGEYLPQVAKLMDRVALVRSMHHPMRNHNAAAAEVLTGKTPAGGDLELLSDDPRSYPTLGSAVHFGLGQRSSLLSYVALPYTIYNVVQLPGQTPGFLGGAFDRFQVSANPNSPDFRIAALELPGNRRASDLESRETLLHRLDSLPSTGPYSKMRSYQERVLELITSESVRRSFDIGQENSSTRDRYGRNLLGQSLLLARRLVEGGVNFVTVFDGQRNGQDANWDSHEKIFTRHRQLIPPADQGFSALIEDLEKRGQLDSTLVLAMAEFGRTPKINISAGRDHWPDCYTMAMVGGGVRGGSIYGASDKIGAYPDLDPVTPADITATVLWRFGIDPRREVKDQTNRPIRLSDGHPLARLF